MLSKEESENIKKQLMKQVESSFPEDKKSQALEQIESMNSEELEEFLEKNNISQNSNVSEGKCIFCSIIFNEIPSYRIDENKSALAVLEINPISKGHIIIIPKEHSHQIKKTEKSLASLIKKLSKKIQKEFSPKEVKVSYSQMFGHSVINLLPIYGNETMDSKRHKAEKSQIEEMQKMFLKMSKSKAEKISKPKARILKEKNLWLPKRLP